jgi:hypothetical protein
MFGPGMIVGLAAALAVVVSLFLPWRSGGVHPSGIPAAFLWDRGATSDPSLLIFLIPLAAVLVLGAVVWGGDVARVFGGLGVLIVAGVFAYQLDRAGNDFGADLGSLLDTGYYVAVIGGFLAWVSAMLPESWGVRRDFEQEEFVDDSVDRRPAETEVETHGRHVAAPAGTPRPVERERVSSVDDA